MSCRRGQKSPRRHHSGAALPPAFPGLPCCRAVSDPDPRIRHPIESPPWRVRRRRSPRSVQGRRSSALRRERAAFPTRSDASRVGLRGSPVRPLPVISTPHSALALSPLPLRLSKFRRLLGALALVSLLTRLLRGGQLILQLRAAPPAALPHHKPQGPK